VQGSLGCYNGKDQHNVAFSGPGGYTKVGPARKERQKRGFKGMVPQKLGGVSLVAKKQYMNLFTVLHSMIR